MRIFTLKPELVSLARRVMPPLTVTQRPSLSFWMASGEASLRGRTTPETRTSAWLRKRFTRARAVTATATCSVTIGL